MGSSLSGSSSGGSKPKCDTCRKYHWGVCYLPDLICHSCKQRGHVMKNFPQSKPGGSEQGRSPKCYEYGDYGHMIQDCPRKRHGGSSSSIS